MQTQNEFLARVRGSRLPRYEQLPALELYKDQVVELVNRYLEAFFYGERAVTDTMVNNYVKLKVIAPPVKKRYCREQLAQLVLTCLLKKVLSIAEVRQLLALQSREDTIAAVYDYFCAQMERALSQDPTVAEQPRWDGAAGQQALIDHAIYSFVHKLYFELALPAVAEQNG